MNPIDKAFEFAKEKHKNQKDDAGLSYFDAHILGVFNILKLVTNETDVLVAGLLHDTLEDTETTPEELEKEFGKTVLDLVLEVTDEGEKDEYGKFFPRLKTQKGIMIKFADRLSNISRMQAWDEQRKAQYLRKSKFWKTDIFNEQIELAKKFFNHLKIEEQKNDNR